MKQVKFLDYYNFSPTKKLPIYIDDDGKKYIKKETELDNYHLLSLIKEVSEDNLNLMSIVGFKNFNDKLLYFVPLYDGIMLDEIIQKKIQLTVEEIKQIIYQLCNGLKSLHQIGIIHRDIKPNNIIIVNRVIKILDYDISRKYDDTKDQDTKYLGTKHYASPEQYGFNQTTTLSDIYSLGKTIQSIVDKCLQPAKQYNFKGIIAKCCELDPSQRFQSVDEIMDEITKDELLPEQIIQLEQLQSVCEDDNLISDIIKLRLNDKQIGVIKHGFEENLNKREIRLLLDPLLSTRQMWQIKRACIQKLDFSLINIMAKPCYTPEEMAIMRINFVNNNSIYETFKRVKNFSIITNCYILSEEEKKLLRNYFYNNTDISQIIQMLEG